MNILKALHFKSFLPLAFFCVSLTVAAEPIKIMFWHSMSGHLGEEVQKIVTGFNTSQSQYQIMAIYKGEYVQTLTNTVAAFRAHQSPDMVQIFEVGSASMIFPKGAIIPVAEILEKMPFAKLSDKLLPAFKFYYSDDHSQLLAMPFNCSTAVMYYNKNAFEKAGLNSDTPPKTWPELQITAQKLLDAGYECGFTTAWPSWIQLESFCAWHNIPYATQENGFKGADAQVIFNHPLVVKHIAMLAAWQKRGLFRYGGRSDDAQSLFTSGKCPILFETSGARQSLIANTKFNIGIASLPYWPSPNAPQNMVPGGGAIWVMQGKDPKVYDGIAQFFNYLLSLPVQVEWQAATGYLPLTNEAVSFLQSSNYFVNHPGADIAIKMLMHKAPTSYSRGIRLGSFTLIRQTNETALESVWSGRRSAKEALNDAVSQNNRLLQEFKESVLIQ